MTGFRIADQGRPTFQRIVQGFRGATAVSSVSAGLGKLLMQGIENWLALLHTQQLASFNAQRFALLFDMVQLTDTRQGFQRHGTGIGLVQIEELPARVRPAAQFNAGRRCLPCRNK